MIAQDEIDASVLTLEIEWDATVCGGRVFLAGTEVEVPNIPLDQAHILRASMRDLSVVCIEMFVRGWDGHPVIQAGEVLREKRLVRVVGTRA